MQGIILVEIKHVMRHRVAMLFPANETERVWALCLRTQITAIDVYDVSVSEAFCNIYVLYFSSLLLLAIISQVII